MGDAPKDREPLLTPGAPTAAPPRENKLLKYGSLAFLIVRLALHDKAMAVNRAVTMLLFGAPPPRGQQASSLPTMALTTVLGALASFQTLPGSAG